MGSEYEGGGSSRGGGGGDTPRWVATTMCTAGATKVCGGGAPDSVDEVGSDDVAGCARWHRPRWVGVVRTVEGNDSGHRTSSST
ncbi:hypothetical protein GUJ93_ZPchr0010g11149 [Zizania palustris]|uniref:Uncharacterized protein n=1 Tax=Zizania palustris TaxID=103762 RepID=A0A8J6BM81_ZIZPA|nr:hypothetical protein GUJ93_ZPchr0010g8160 [Zizania palustris]KAG8087867.1 hypothetical protein GUJ93_ZPchr0010g11149 [Zizania palustris]